jgi:hypothetical protein
VSSTYFARKNALTDRMAKVQRARAIDGARIQRRHEENVARGIRDALRPFGRVHDIALVCDDYDVLELYADRGLLKRRVAAAYTRDSADELNDLEAMVGATDSSLAHTKRQHDGRHCIGAFVTFDSVAAKQAVRSATPCHVISRCA